MIVRIATEGQYELLESDGETLDQLDHQAVAACRADDQEQFDGVFKEMIEFVRAHGRQISDDELTGSDVILPPPDSSIDDARAELTGEGWIPD